MTIRFRAVLAVALLGLGGADAVESTDSTADRWVHELAETRRLLLDERWAEAEAPSSRLLEELMADLKGGPGAGELVAVSLAQLALVEAALDRRREALWHIRAAAIFNPDLAATDMGAEFGAVGRSLDAWRGEPTLRGAGPPPATDTAVAGLLPPRIRSGNFVVLRASAEQLRLLDPSVHVDFVIDREGLPVEPRIHGRLDNPAPLLLSLELLLHEFRFSPATFNGEPVAVRWELALPITQGALRRALWQLKRSWIEGLLREGDWQRAFEEAEALSAALERGSGPGNQEKQTIVAYYLSRARAGLGETDTPRP